MQQLDQKYVAQVEYQLSDIEKRGTASSIDEIYRLFILNKDKVLPLKLLARCAQLFISDGSPSQLEVSEQMQAKFMAVILREFRKNIEYTKYLEKKREEMRLQAKTPGGGPRNAGTKATIRKPIVNDLFTTERNNQRMKKLSSSPPL